MSFNDLLLKANFCSREKREFELSNVLIPYFCCKKTIHTSCKKEKLFNCANCDRIYARYIVINLCDKEIKNFCDRYIFSSIENFDNFQKEHLSKIFFYENETIRYNIYLLFVYDENNDVENKKSFEQNINYARKLFLTINEFKEYFGCFDDIKESLEKNIVTNDKKIFEKLSEMVKKLETKNAKALLLQKEEFKDYINIINEYTIYDYNFDKVSKIKGNATDFIRNQFYKINDRNNEKAIQIENIQKLLIHKFRENCFANNTEINCSKVNVIYGSNAAGKTSILDAIEFGFTGETHRFKNDSSLKDSRVDIITSDSKKHSNPTLSQAEHIKRQWYPYGMGSLNEMFCRVNFFDTDATYRFALEDGNNQVAFLHIKKLLCNSKLLDVEETLNNYYNAIEITIQLLSKLKDNKGKFSVFYIPKNNKSEDFHEENKKLFDLQNICEETLKQIRNLINEQISSSIKIINNIFRRLFSYQYSVIWNDDMIQLQQIDKSDVITINAMSTAQKVCLALSVIFAQFLLAENSPRIILLDESVANLDSLHLLNLLDFLRELSNSGMQIFFTTANDDVAHIATYKFNFLKNDFNLYKVSKTEEGLTKIDSMI